LNNYSDILLAEIVSLKEHSPEMTWATVSDFVFNKYKIMATPNALRKAASRFAAKHGQFSLDPEYEGFPIPFVEEYTDIMDFEYEDSIVISDVHLPFYNHELANKMLALAKRHGIQRLRIAGDLFDFKGLSRFKSLNNISAYDTEYELDIGAAFLNKCGEQFTTIDIISGNHDIRSETKLEKKLPFKTMFRMVLQQVADEGININISNYPMMFVRGDEYEDTLICHPENYSRIRGNIPRDLCTKYMMNVISAHSHHALVTTHISGKYFVAESGCLADPNKQEYLAYQMSTHPMWVPGFIMIKNERPYVIFEDEKLTDFDFWLK